MKYEFHAQYPFALQDSVPQAGAMEWLAGKRSSPPHTWPELATVQDDYQRMQLLSQAIATAYKEQARTGTKRESGGFKYWLDRRADAFLKQQRRWLDALELASALPDLTILPRNAFSLQLIFTLRKPYISRDDTDFYIIDNPVKKEWVFKVPYVAPSQWKGALRAAIMQELAAWWQGLSEETRQARSRRKNFVAKRLQITRLFGNEKSVLIDDRRFESYLDNVGGEYLARWYRRALRMFCTHTGFIAGRLHFYPTYFDRIGLEVINPHPRDIGAGKQPIYFECVPAGTSGTFTLLYVPFDRTGNEAETCRQVAEDLTLLAEGLQALFTLYGFGAKTSSGFGLADDRVSGGRIQTNVLEATQQADPPQKPVMPEALRAFLQQFPDEGFSLKPNKWRKQRKATNAQRKQYMKARRAHADYQKARAAYEVALAAWEAQAVEPAQSFVGVEFVSFSQLAEDTARSLAAKLSAGGEA